MNPTQNQAPENQAAPPSPPQNQQPNDPVEQAPQPQRERAQHITMLDGTELPEKLHPMVVLQQGERVVAIIKRHPMGILALYFSGLIALVLLAALAFFLLPNAAEQYNIADAQSIIYLALGGLLVLMMLILLVATVIYWENKWIVTTDSLTQISQTSLFDRQVAQLSMDNLEDVTVDQNGILPHVFNYGSLKVETAGERSKFVFPYCPNPNDYARKILEIHEAFLEERRNIQNHNA